MDQALAMGLRVLGAVEALAKPLEAAAAKPGGRGLLVAATIAGTLSGLVFGIGGAVAAVWVHDQSSRGTVTLRIDKQDTAINGLIDATNGLLDESEGDMEWMAQAFEALQAGTPIPKRSDRGRNKIRRSMPAKLPPQ
jgi:hypothetical protein